ncbi:ribosome assembly RNA-binding protein YhbY [Ligilactobacillus sp. Marseille-Q7487]|jgi:RNA-binding protein|uniref:ribosome assembly RNA-binding protein YhbY n=1 Tax=Ligilactobacillus sp. Marseille-Q7487 TaxID=3022128 RepID=UPI0015B4417B|nr:ribosome assembly RNA-binding protein YhbY [Ligilactobacillus sp. Marseille-Q7487]
MNLKGKQKRYLRAQAHDMRPLFQIGKDGLDENWLNQVIDAIDKHELLKVNILQNSLVEEDEAIEYIQTHSQIQVVQKIGRVLVLYKRSSKPQNRKYSSEVAKL